MAPSSGAADDGNGSPHPSPPIDEPMFGSCQRDPSRSNCRDEWTCPTQGDVHAPVSVFAGDGEARFGPGRASVPQRLSLRSSATHLSNTGRETRPVTTISRTRGENGVIRMREFSLTKRSKLITFLEGLLVLCVTLTLADALFRGILSGYFNDSRGDAALLSVVFILAAGLTAQLFFISLAPGPQVLIEPHRITVRTLFGRREIAAKDVIEHRSIKKRRNPLVLRLIAYSAPGSLFGVRTIMVGNVFDASGMALSEFIPKFVRAVRRNEDEPTAEHERHIHDLVEASSPGDACPYGSGQGSF
mgnify:CR=1 FL=1